MRRRPALEGPEAAGRRVQDEGSVGPPVSGQGRGNPGPAAAGCVHKRPKGIDAVALRGSDPLADEEPVAFPGERGVQPHPPLRAAQPGQHTGLEVALEIQHQVVTLLPELVDEPRDAPPVPGAAEAAPGVDVERVEFGVVAEEGREAVFHQPSDKGGTKTRPERR